MPRHPTERHFLKPFCIIIPIKFHISLLSSELSLHDPFACHALHLFNQASSSVQGLDIITAANTPATY